MERIILKEMLKEFCVREWTGLQSILQSILLRIICGDTETSGCMKWEKLFSIERLIAFQEEILV